MYPVFFTIGSFQVPSFGIMAMLGMLSAFAWIYRSKKNFAYSEDDLLNVMIAAIFSGFAGAKLLYWIVEWKEIVRDPSFILRTLTSGLVFYGALIAGILGILVYVRRHRQSFFAYADLILPAFALGQAFGRIGCFCAGCCYGAATDTGLRFYMAGAERIPTQLYESAFLFLLWAVLGRLYNGKKRPKDGVISAVYFIAYALWRFIIEFFRADDRGSVGLLSTSQFIALIALPFGLWILYYVLKGKTEQMGNTANSAKERYNAWLASELTDEATKAELQGIAGDEKEIEERFYRTLEFGTAGLRGILGAGTNRMNNYVVRRATQGLADYLKGVEGASALGVAIAYDSRLFSEEFAHETAAVLADNGIRTVIFPCLHSVPQLSYAVRQQGCIAGVVITASHNPSKYNGYKVYWAHGGQCGPEQADEILGKIEALPMLLPAPCAYEQAVAEGRITVLGQDADEAYYAGVLALLNDPQLLKDQGGSLPIVYTPLHGTGSIPVREILKRAGISSVTIVPEQAEPDGHFPTVSAPNPENPDAFKLAIPLAEAKGAKVCLATDPDADRLGIAVKKTDGEWTVLTGNQIGCLLLNHILSAKKAKGVLPADGIVVKSVVSTAMADAIAASYGVELINVLTGFRFIGEQIDRCEKTKENTFLFGFEESYGFLTGNISRDKDSILSSVLSAEMCLTYAQRGMTLYDGLMELFNTYGWYKERVASYTLEGKEGMEKIAGTMAGLRKDPVWEVAGTKVVRAEDYVSGIAKLDNGTEEAVTLPKSNVLRYVLSTGEWIVVRPSGTEPKLKLYIGGKADSSAAVEARTEELYDSMNKVLSSMLFGE